MVVPLRGFFPYGVKKSVKTKEPDGGSSARTFGGKQGIGVNFVYTNRNTRVWPATVLMCKSMTNEWSLEQLSYRTSQLTSARAFTGLDRDAPDTTKVPMYHTMVVESEDPSEEWNFKIVGKVTKERSTTLGWVNAKMEELWGVAIEPDFEGSEEESSSES